MKVPEYVLTEHAKVVLAEREIPLAWVERVLANPERSMADDADPSLQHAIDRISENGDRFLRVIYNPRSALAYRDGVLRPRLERQIMKMHYDEQADALRGRLRGRAETG